MDKAAKDAPVIARIGAAAHIRDGYRRINLPRSRRSCHEPQPRSPTGSAQVPRKRPRKRVAAASSASPTGQQMVMTSCSTIATASSSVPDGNRRVHQEGLAIDVDGRIRSARVIEVLSHW
jgi:hypothetical protein